MRSVTESGEQDARGASASCAEISPDQVRASLDKILASPGFVNADRVSRFLRHVVEQTLAGQTDRLKETLLGIDVFGRKPAYDPRIDAVVRTEAVKLRARLRDYYQTEGREDQVCIDLPKGGYIPVFRSRQEPIEESATTSDPVPPPDRAKALARSRLALVGLGAIVLLAFGLWLALRKGTAAGAHSIDMSSIAVLPFEDLSAQHDQEYFCDGMTEEIIDALTKAGGLRVVARTSSFAFKGKQQDIREIGRKLNVSTVLEGSVRKSGNKLRVTAQLNSVADGYHLWSETYERQVQDVFSLQDEISRAIVNTLQTKLAGQPSTARPRAENLEAYDLYLKGRYHWGRWRTEGAEKALQYFEQAIAKDPTYAPAYAGMADSYCWLGFFSAMRPNEAMPKAKKAALRAIELDGSLPSAHASLGYVKALYDFDWPAAGHEFQRAIQLNPGLADGHFGYGICYLAPMGRTKESVREMNVARDLDPLSLATNTYLGLAYQMDGNPDQATVYYKKALELDPGFFEAHDSLAGLFLHRRQFPEYYAELDQVKNRANRGRLELSRACAQALEGKRDEALAAVRRWEHPEPGTYVRPTAIANVYAALGDREAAIRWLRQAYTDRDGMLVYLSKDGVYRPFATDPRFQELRRNIGIAQ